jgi:DNA-binding MarR family transcriptional regulator
MRRSAPLRYLSPLHKSGRRIGLYLEPKLSGLGVNGAEGHLLSYLRAYSPSPVGELARVFGLRGSTLTGMLDRLAGQDLLVRELHPEDRRSFLVRITPKGRKTADAIQKHLDRLESAIDRRISRRDLEGFQAVVRAIGEVTGMEPRDVSVSGRKP